MAEKKQIDPNLLLIGAGGLLLYFGVVKPILETVGLKDSAEDKENANEVEKAVKLSAWSPNYYLNNKAKYSRTIDEASAQFLADEINESWSWYDDDEQRIFAAFRMMRSKYELSMVAFFYSQKYKQDLLTRLKNAWYYWQDGLTDEEFITISKIVNRLPDF